MYRVYRAALYRKPEIGVNARYAAARLPNPKLASCGKAAEAAVLVVRWHEHVAHAAHSADSLWMGRIDLDLAA